MGEQLKDPEDYIDGCPSRGYQCEGCGTTFDALADEDHEDDCPAVLLREIARLRRNAAQLDQWQREASDALTAVVGALEIDPDGPWTPDETRTAVERLRAEADALRARNEELERRCDALVDTVREESDLRVRLADECAKLRNVLQILTLSEPEELAKQLWWEDGAAGIEAAELLRSMCRSLSHHGLQRSSGADVPAQMGKRGTEISGEY